MKAITFLLGLCLSISAFAQDYDYGKVSKEELEEKFHPLDSSASAAYLYKYRRSHIEYDQNIGFQLITDVQERIKIYNQEGFDYATNKVRLYKSGSDEEKISTVKAVTYNLVSGKIEETKLERNGVFKTEVSKYRDETNFTMPDIKEGSVIEYKYTITSPFYWNVDDFIFQYDIPIKKIEATFETPEYFNFKLNSKGFIMLSPKVTSKNDKITFTDKTRTSGTGFSGVSTTFSSSDVNFLKNITSYSLTDIPALKDEPFVNNINNYRSAVQYELSYTNFPQAPLKYYSTTWEDVVKTIYESSSFDSELEKTGYFEEDIDALIGSISDPIARLSIIYDFIKNKLSWNGYSGKYTEVGVRKAYKDLVGNVAEINLMLTAMLRYAGLNANPVLVSTRQNGIPLFPTLDGYNYVISAVEFGNDVILLDATSKYSTPNVLPYRVLNWEGRIVRKDRTSSTINLYPNEKSKNSISMVAFLDENGDLSGSLRKVKTSHDAMLYRENYLETDKDAFVEKLENRYSGMEIDEFEVKNDTDLSKPVMETYKFSLESQADIINDKIYFSPLFFFKTKENPFKLEKREFPVDFGYPSGSRYVFSINLPQNYKIESLPEPKIFQLPDNLGRFVYNIEAKTGVIQLVIDEEINVPILSPIYYDTIKLYFEEMIEKQAEQIVLSKT